MEKRKTPPCPTARVSRFPTAPPLSHPRRMQDRDLYAKLLGLEQPWEVRRVELDLPKLEVHVYVEHVAHQWRCPDCEQEGPLYDHQPERAWRHLDTMQYTTMLHARPPRVNCSAHGPKIVRLPWADRGSRFTLLFERFAIDLLKITSVEAAGRLLRLSWKEAFGIQERAVERGLARKPAEPPVYVGIDEKAFWKGQDSYFTIVCDLAEGSVEWIGEDRKANTLGGYFDQFTPEQLARIEGLAMDMWRPYAKAVVERIPEAEDKIIYDRFHVMKCVGEALDTIRKQEHRELSTLGNDILKGTKYDWLRSRENVPRKHRRRFAALKRRKLKTGRAWAIKEALRHLWDFKTSSRAHAFWKSWFNWATHSKLPAMVKAAKKLKRHERRILNYFRHRITNSMAESLNSQIERLKRIANGYRNPDNFRIAILFRHGGLDLYPTTH